MKSRGNEELAFVINTYMDGMVRCFSKYGGDIIKFVGDAMIVMWPRTNVRDDNEKKMIIRKAIQSAIDIQKENHNKKISAKVPALKVKVSKPSDFPYSQLILLFNKIGIAFGHCGLLYVGD